MFSITLDGKSYPVDSVQNVAPMDFVQLIRAITVGLDFTVDGMEQEAAPVQVRLTFKKVPFFLLVNGGVLPPLPSICNRYYLFLDKNISDNNEPRATAAQMLGGCIVNPIMGCFERLEASFSDFKKEHDDYAAKRIRDSFSRCIVFDNEMLKVIFDIRASLDEDEQREADFLAATAAQIAAPWSPKTVVSRVESITTNADKFGIERSSIVFISCIQIVFAAQKKLHQPASLVLNPKIGMSNADAMNGLADIRQIKLLALAGCLGIDACLLTNDRNLALLWAGLRMEGTKDSDPPEFTICPDPELFPMCDFEQTKKIFSGEV